MGWWNLPRGTLPLATQARNFMQNIYPNDSEPGVQLPPWSPRWVLLNRGRKRNRVASPQQKKRSPWVNAAAGKQQSTGHGSSAKAPGRASGPLSPTLPAPPKPTYSCKLPRRSFFSSPSPSTGKHTGHNFSDSPCISSYKKTT